jgi:hypothetical protein
MEGILSTFSWDLVRVVVVKVKEDGRASTGREATWGRWTVDQRHQRYFTNYQGKVLCYWYPMFPLSKTQNKHSCFSTKSYVYWSYFAFLTLQHRLPE